MIEISTIGTIHINTKGVTRDTKFKVNLEKNIIEFNDGVLRVFYFNSKERKLVYTCGINVLPSDLYIFGVQVVEDKKIIDDYLKKSLIGLLCGIPIAGVVAYGIFSLFEYIGWV